MFSHGSNGTSRSLLFELYSGKILLLSRYYNSLDRNQRDSEYYTNIRANEYGMDMNNFGYFGGSRRQQ